MATDDPDAAADAGAAVDPDAAAEQEERAAGSGDFADRIERFRRNSPRVAGPLGGVFVALALVLLFTPLFVAAPSGLLVFVEEFSLFLLFGLLVVGLNLQFGHTGLVNFGHVVFFAVGGYTAGLLTANAPSIGIGLGLPWPVGVVGAVLAAALLGGLLGVTTLRLRGDFLAIVTLAVAEILHDLLGSFQSITGGGIGLLSIPTPIADLTDSAAEASLVTAILLLGLLLVTYAGVRRLTDSPYGRVLRAIRADERVAETLGKDVFGYKLWSFVYGAAIAGAAGALYAFTLGAISPGLFTISVTVTVWVGMLVGGPGTDWAVVVGVGILVGFRLLTRFLNGEIPAVSADQFASVRLMMVGLLLMFIIRYRPQGLFGDAGRLGVDR
jgi:branched-chain amino acid transport system permease protein